MKKILSLALLAIMLLGTLSFAGCDTYIDTLEKYMNELSGQAARTTITKEEWDTAMQATNYTFVATQSTHNYQIFGEYAGSDIHQRITDIESDMAFFEAYMATIDGVAYSINKEESGFVAYEETGFPGSIKFEGVFDDDTDEIYTKLVYNEKTKSYQYIVDDVTLADIYFENGSIKTAHIVDGDTVYDFRNFGTTAFELPEFTFGTAKDQ